jgi:alanine dehydrogenase
MLLLDNETIAQVLTMKACIDAQERAFRRLATGEAIHRPRIDLYAPTGRSDDYFRWGSMEGADSVEGIFAIRVKSDIVSWPRSPQGYWTEEKYCREPGTYCGLIWLFSTRTGEPLAILQDGYLQHLRVGGGAGLGVRYLARQDSRTVAILGSGGMARTYLEAICLERPIERVRVYSPTPAHRQTFAEEMSAKLEIAVEPSTPRRPR